MERGNLERMKIDYEEIRKKYNLPGFQELNEDFCIEKVAESETDFLVREIRRYVADKFVNCLRFVESILNPVNVPMFVFSVTKIITEKEKEKLREIYKKMAKREVELIGLDIKFSEEKEAEFINTSYKIWQEIKTELSGVIEFIKSNLDNKIEGAGEGYFG